MLPLAELLVEALDVLDHGLRLIQRQYASNNQAGESVQARSIFLSNALNRGCECRLVKRNEPLIP